MCHVYRRHHPHFFKSISLSFNFFSAIRICFVIPQSLKSCLFISRSHSTRHAARRLRSLSCCSLSFLQLVFVGFMIVKFPNMIYYICQLHFKVIPIFCLFCVLYSLSLSCNAIEFVKFLYLPLSLSNQTTALFQLSRTCTSQPGGAIQVVFNHQRF